ncbi:MAG: DUF4276 family protein [Planctomycetaceae bacterium]|jgi:hypothetical protein|nr:DUF4276 family protein [Planctomycetaceae bacterium]
MNNCVEIVVLVEGQTERIFVQKILSPYFVNKKIFLTPILLSKPGEKGGDVKFSRAQNDIGRHLKQRKDTWITLMVDYYGIENEWPGFEKSKQQSTHTKKAEIINQGTMEQIQKLFPNQNVTHRFIPYVSMHEIEALYFSDPVCLANKLNIKESKIISILAECGEPESINGNNETAPSKRLEKLFHRFQKTSTGIAIAEAIGITTMRKECPLFNTWLEKIETLGKYRNK